MWTRSERVSRRINDKLAEDDKLLRIFGILPKKTQSSANIHRSGNNYVKRLPNDE